MRGRLHVGTGLPIMDLTVNGTPLSCLVDTGFTGDLAVGVGMANHLSLVSGYQWHVSETVAGGAEFTTSQASIDWFGSIRPIGVIIYPRERVGPVDGIIGVHLLIGHILVVDFNEGDVLIKDPAVRGMFP